MTMDSKISLRVRDVPPSGIRKFFDIASEMKDCISLGVGEPDFDTPWNIRESAIYALESGKTHYSSNHGSTELRKAILQYLDMQFGLKYELNQAVVTVGASEALDLVFRAIMDPGRRGAGSLAILCGLYAGRQLRGRRAGADAPQGM